MEVWGGSNKDDLKLLGSIIPTPAKKGEFSTLLELKVGFSPTSLKCIKTIAHSIPAIPKWQSYSRPPGWVFISEVIVD